MKRLDIALVGYPGSGKSTAGDYLESTHGFTQCIGNAYLLQKAEESGISLGTRQEFAAFHRALRIVEGATFIAQLGLALPDERVAHVGIQNRLDVDEIIRNGGVIAEIGCMQAVRFQRTAGSDAKYPSQYAAFQTNDARENSEDPFGSHLDYVLSRAHHYIDNTGTKEELFRQLDELVDQYV